jgi:hypothetical protein
MTFILYLALLTILVSLRSPVPMPPFDSIITNHCKLLAGKERPFFCKFQISSASFRLI